MGLCNCNLRNNMIIRADYNINVDLIDQKQKGEMKRNRTFNEAQNGLIESKMENKTYKVVSSNSGKLTEQTYHQSRRTMLYNKITEKSMCQTKLSTQIKTFGAESKFIKEVTNELMSPEDQDILINALTNHFMFSKLDNSMIQYLISKMKKYQIEEQYHIFLEGEESQSMYIITSGKVELYKTGTKKLIIKSKQECFGELGILVPNSLRTYSVKTIVKGFIYGIDSHLFKEIKAKLIKPDKELLELIKSVPLFSYLEEGDKENLCKFSYMITIKQNQKYISNDVFFIIKSGNIISKVGNQQIEMKNHSFFGLRRLLFDSSQISYEMQAKNNQSEVYIFSLEAFIEILGIDIQYQLIFPYFKSLMINNTFFSSLFNELQLDPIFQLFKLKEYKENAIVCHKHSYGKILIVITGKLLYESKNKSDSSQLEFGMIYGDHLITSGTELDNEIIAQFNSMIIEAEWEDIKSKVTLFNSSIIKKMTQLSIVKFLKNTNESKLLEMASIIKSHKFTKGKLVCSKDFNNDKFFLIIKGEAKLKLNGRTLRRYGKGSCFGELFLLNIEDSGMTIISSTDKLSLLALPGVYFMNLIQQKMYNEYIQNKMCNEDREISLKDLYIIKEFSGKSFLVHNTVSMYIVETKLKSTKELESTKRAIQASKSLDHPFIVKYVKMVESKYHAVFIYEYVKINLSISQLINSKKLYINKVSSIVFYTACLLEILSYMNSKHFIHRNINQDNVLIDSTGYIKLIHFNLTKKLKDTMMTNSVVGIPCYSAPELLKGDKYSFSCDYWSIGVLFYLFYYGKLPFSTKETDDSFGVYNKIINNEIDYSNCDNKVKEIFISLINTDSTRRCQSIALAKKLSCFKDFSFEKLFARKMEPPLIPPNIHEFDKDILLNKNRSLDNELQKITNTCGADLLQSWDNYF